jgi:cob(I)alamin adenosyltransferase
MNPTVLTYLNRLSDWLFAVAPCRECVAGVADIMRVPKD